MSREKQPIDEYTLAAYLSGALSTERCREVVVYLAENADARDLLCMAHEALEATEQPVAEPFPMPPSTREPAAPETRLPAPRTPHPALPWHHVRRVAIAALGVVVLGLGLRTGLYNTDGLRGDTAEQSLKVRVSTPALQFQWNSIEEAYYYRLVIWDVEAVESVTQHQTKATRLGRNDAFVLWLHHELKTGRLYSVRIDAMDVQNRLIKRSEMVDFSLEE